MQILDTIRNGIEEVREAKGDLVLLQEKTLELSVQSYYLAALVADWHESSNNAEFYYKRAVEGDVANNQGPISRAEYQAKHRFANLNEDYRSAENTYKRLQLALAQCNVVIEQARQTISYLKTEKKYETT